MASVPIAAVRLQPDPARALSDVPKAGGFGQLLDREGGSLIIGRPANLRRWAAAHLGMGPPPRSGRRPRTDLSSVAETLVFAVTASAFRQRLLFEREMARSIPTHQRHDLRPAVFLRLDLTERFPRVTLRVGAGDREHRFGPFRDRRAAEKALAALHKRFSLRSCEAVFEPDPMSPLGTGCLHAQVRSCAAPCLGRIGEPGYRGLAQQAAALLADPEGRPEEVATWLPPWVSAVRGLGLVVETTRDRIELFPVRDGAVLEEAAVSDPLDQPSAAAAGLDWPAPPADRDDSAWLSAWLHAPRRCGAYLVVKDPADRDALAERVRAAGQVGARLPRVIS